MSRAEKRSKNTAGKREVSEETFYKQRSRFGTIEVTQVKEYRQLPPANARLKRLLAGRDPKIDVMEELPAMIRSANGAEFTGKAVNQRLAKNGIERIFSGRKCFYKPELKFRRFTFPRFV